MKSKYSERAIDRRGGCQPFRLLLGFPRRRCDLFISSDLQASGTERVRDQFQRIIVVMDFGIQVSKIESIRDVFLVNLAEVLVPFAA